LKRRYIPKKNGNRRPLSIPALVDRARQALSLQALQPLAETMADPNSYRLRPERRCADAIDPCCKVLRQQTSATWIVEGDIHGFFDNMAFSGIETHIPMNKRCCRNGSAWYFSIPTVTVRYTMHRTAKLHCRVPCGALVMLERSAGKLARCVLRGPGRSDPAWLPGGNNGGVKEVLIADDVKQAFAGQDWTPEENAYLDMHAARLAYTVNLIQEYHSVFNVRTILDIGPHFLTSCIKKFIKPDVSISTLGRANERLAPPSVVDKHIRFDLNCCADQPLHTTERFDLIVFAETIEHLYTSPTLVLKCLRNLLRTEDGVLIIQTPNAVSLTKRLKMVIGINPFELIRENRDNPGHFREYTMEELITYGTQAGLKLYRKEFCNYWQPSGWLARLLEKAHSSFREGVTISFLS
jgi:hypothetical protein